MAVTEVKEITDRRGGRYAGFDEDSDRRSWRVKTSAKTDTFLTVRTACWSAGTLPRPLIDFHPEHFGMLCKALSGDPISGPSGEEPYLWIFHAEYDTKPIDKEKKEREEQPDPLLRIARWKMDFNVRDRIINKDLDGKAFLNSAYDVYIDPVTFPGIEAIMLGRKNFQSMPDFFVDLIERINDGEVNLFGRSFPAETLLFLPRGISEDQEENGVDFRQYDWSLIYNRDTWKEKRVDNGFNRLTEEWFSLSQEDKDAALENGTVNTQYKIPIEVDGERPTEPQLLKNGIPLDPSKEATILEWDKIEKADFSILPDLPNA